MYSTCLFCHRALGANDTVEHFPVGRRLAYDMGKGRLWVVCHSCGRWNLTPIEERWEAIEECERIFRGTTIRVSTPNVQLAKLRSGLDLVRIGSPLRPEFAAWRYAGKFGKRRRTFHIVAGAGVASAAIAGLALGPAVAPTLALGAISIVAFPGLTTVMGVIPMVSALAARDYLMHDRVIAQFNQGKRLVVVRAKHLGDVKLRVDRDEGKAALEVPHDTGWAFFEGAAAMHAASVLLAGANRFGATSGQVQTAVNQIEQHGDAAGFLEAASTRGVWRARVMSMLNVYRSLGAMQLEPTERLALEMAMHEEAERRAMAGELRMLEDAWRDAEQIASIADEQLTPGFELLLKRRGESSGDVTPA